MPILPARRETSPQEAPLADAGQPNPPTTIHRPACATCAAWCRGLVALLFLAALPSLLAACQSPLPGTASVQGGSATQMPAATYSLPTRTPIVPVVDLALPSELVAVKPLPLRAGFPFTITARIENKSELRADNIPLVAYLSPVQDELGFTSFLETLTVTVPATASVPITIPVRWNLPGGEHRLWLQVNHVPNAWQSRFVLVPEANLSDNTALMDLVVAPFDAYVSELCPGRVDLEVGPLDVVPDLARQQVLVRVHNPGNQAVYNVPVVAIAGQTAGVVYTPAIPPCGGTAQVRLTLDRPLAEGELLTILVNPKDWENGLREDSYDNNQVSVSAGLPGAEAGQVSGLQDYDFSIDAAQIEIAQAWVVLVKVQNLGTRDAADVPILVENAAGRKVNDLIPFVQGNGLGLAAIRVGYLWTPGGTLTFTVNPEEARGVLPESNRQNNVATFVLP